MVQRIDYAVFPDIREPELLGFVNKLFGHVHRQPSSMKDLREWLRDQNAWDKDSVPAALEFLDLRTKGATVTMGTWASQMFAIDDLEAQKTHLYKRLLDENTLLCKYVFEALDMEGGGRLHSTYELHRMLTSYVYPGTHIRLTDFQNWIKWAVVSGRLKLIGIRWGLTDLGKEAVPRLRSVDVDEFLEDEAADAEAGEAEADEPALVAKAAAPAAAARADAPASAAPSPAASSPAASIPASSPPAARAAAAEDLPDEEELDLPPDAPPVDESTFARYAEALEATPIDEPAPTPKRKAAKAAAAPSPVAAHAPAAVPVAATGPGHPVAVPALPRMTLSPTSLVTAARLEQACAKEPQEAAELIAQLRELGRSRGVEAGGSLLAALGLEARMAANEPARHLFLAALLARLFALRPDGALADLLVERAGAIGPIAMLSERPEALAEVVVRWGLALPDQASQQVRNALLDAVIGGRALAARPDLPTVLAETPSSEQLLGTLTQGLLRGAGPTAAFWLVREMVRAGLWVRPAHTEIAVVPTRALRMMAYRLRLLDAHFASSSARMLEVARRLASLLPAGSVEAQTAELLASDDHLRFDCARLVICQQPCALHTEA